jgi:hypothetical protein
MSYPNILYTIFRGIPYSGWIVDIRELFQWSIQRMVKIKSILATYKAKLNSHFSSWGSSSTQPARLQPMLVLIFLLHHVYQYIPVSSSPHTVQYVSKKVVITLFKRLLSIIAFSLTRVLAVSTARNFQKQTSVPRFCKKNRLIYLDSYPCCVQTFFMFNTTFPNFDLIIWFYIGTSEKKLPCITSLGWMQRLFPPSNSIVSTSRSWLSSFGGVSSCGAVSTCI